MFFGEGPIRLAPVFAKNKIYVGSDDGAVYCLGASDGDLLWKFKTYDQPQCVPGNGRMISRWPVRAGLVKHYSDWPHAWFPDRIGWEEREG